MKKLNLVYKLCLALFLLGFAVWFQNWVYNTALITLLILLIRFEKVSLFRFPRQGYFFAALLMVMFILQAVNGYGKILFQFPLNITITDDGLLTAFLFVSQVLLIFLLFGAAIYTADKPEVVHYYRSLNGADRGWKTVLQGWLRIGLYVMYLLPKALDYRQTVSTELKAAKAEKEISFKDRFLNLLDHIYRFIAHILDSSEKEYAAFKQQTELSVAAAAQNWQTVRHALVTITVALVHLPLLGMVRQG